MGSIINMVFSGAVEAAAGNVVDQAFSSIVDKHETQEELGLTLFGLENKVKELQCVIAEARERRIANPKLAEWLSIIINATYRGDYILHTFQNRNSLSSLIASEGTSGWSISSFFRAAKRKRMSRTSPFLDEELREPSNVLKMLNMISVTSFLGMLYAQPKIDRPLRTYLYMDHNRMVGRDKEKEELIKFLLEPKMVGAENVDILSIHGHEGVGKSTLALHCYYDPMVQSHFSQKFYIRFMSNRRAYGTHRNIPKQCSSSNITNCDDDNTIVVMLKQNLSSERFLLILDIYGLSDTMDWGVLWHCLRCGKEGSKVVLVSDSTDYQSLKKMANIRMVKPIMLDIFPKDMYWLFFKEHAFGTADPKDYPELAKIGEEIAGSLEGSIWGAKILGGVLRDNLTTQFWAKVLDGISGSPSGGLYSSIETILYLLPVRLKLKGIGYEYSKYCPNNGLRTFRELMVLGPNHYRPTEREREYSIFEFVVMNHFSLSGCTVFTATCYPFWD